MTNWNMLMMKAVLADTKEEFEKAKDEYVNEAVKVLGGETDGSANSEDGESEQHNDN